LEKLAQETGLAGLVRRLFPDLHGEMMSLVHFIVQKGLPLSRGEPWSAGHLHPADGPVVSQRVSELLLKITEDDRQRFLSLWLAKMTEDDFLCYDITSVSGVKPMHLILDRGFYSEANVGELLERRHHFTVAVPTGRKWMEAAIDRHYESIASPERYRQVDDAESLYVVTDLRKWGEDRRRAYLHVYYNVRQATDEFDRFTRELLQYKTELESGRKVEDHEESYARFLTARETPKRGLRVSFNDAEIRKHRKRYAGFFCLLSSAVKDPMEALRICRAKDAVENSFDDLKKHLDMRRLRIHTSAAMDSRLFLQFLALILICRIRNTIQDDAELRNLTVREVMEDMETLVRITYSGRYGQLYAETGPLQRKIMEVFGLTLPT